MITEIEMRYTTSKSEVSNVCAGLVRYETPGGMVTINEPETGRAIEMRPHQARDLVKSITKMLDILGYSV